MPKQKQIIIFDLPEAASLKTVTAWVTADGRFFARTKILPASAAPRIAAARTNLTIRCTKFAAIALSATPRKGQRSSLQCPPRTGPASPW